MWVRFRQTAQVAKTTCQALEQSKNIPPRYAIRLDDLRKRATPERSGEQERHAPAAVRW
jgi:hypothetical protein